MLHRHDLRRPVVQLLAAAVAVVCCGGSARSAEPVAVQPILDAYTIRRWGVEDGLPEGTVTSVALAPDGFVWLTTPHRVVRFDGVSFVSVRPGDLPANVPRHLNSILSDAGGLWVSGEDGVMRAVGRAWQSVPLEGGEVGADGGEIALETPDGTVVQPMRRTVFWVRRHPDGSVWAATSVGLFRFEGRAFRWIPPPPGVGTPFFSAAMDAAGTVWFAGRGGLSAFDGHAHVAHAFASEAGQGALFQVFAGRGGDLWGKCVDGHLFRRSGGEWSDVPPPGLRQSALLDVPDGVWIGAVEGLYRWTPNTWHLLPVSDVDRPYDVRCVVASADGSLWVGAGNGLFHLRPRSIRMFLTGSVAVRQPIHVVLPKGDGSFWVGLGMLGLCEGQPGAFEPCARTAALLRSTSVSALQRDPDGTLWVGTKGSHLWMLPPTGAAKQLRSRVGYASRDVTSLLVAGRCWVGTREGLLVADQGWLASAGGPEDAVLALGCDGQGALWVGTQCQGLWRREVDGKWSKPGVALPVETVRALCSDREALLIATPKGLVRYSGRESYCFTREQGLADDDVRQMLDDGEGHLWLGFRSSIQRLDKVEMASVAEGRRGALAACAFGVDDGLKADLVGGDHSGPLAVRSDDGRLWFATRAGLALFDPARRVAPGDSPVPRVDEVTVGAPPDSTCRWMRGDGQPFALPPGSREVAVHFTAPCFSAPERALFRTLLEGYEIAWSPPMLERVRTYPRLPPGSYRFRVMAATSSGGWRESDGAVRFTVLPFFWQTAWFAGAAGVAALALAGLCGGLWARRRARRKLAEARQEALAREEAMAREQAVERERARIARDIHDDLGAGLTQVALLSELAQAESGKPELLHVRLDKIFQTASSLAHGLNEIVWAVNPANDTVESIFSYLGSYAEECLRTAGCRLRLDFPAETPVRTVRAAVRHHLFCAVREALNNTVKYAGPCEVHVRGALDGEVLAVEVADDGCGFDAAALPAIPGRHNGLANMRRRMAEVGGTFELRSARGEGARLTFRAPIG